MAAYIQHIATTVPEHAYRQEELRETIKKRTARTELQRRIIHKIYSRSGIHTRYSVLGDFHMNGDTELYLRDSESSPGTGERNRFFEKKGRELFVKTAQKLVGEGTGISPDQITHLLTI